MRDRIVALKGRPVAALFAEPVVSRKSGALELAWYSDHPGTPTPLSALDSTARAAVARRLRELLTALAPLLGDETIGPLVARALYIQTADAAFALGQEPVLINWAILPPQIAHDDQGALDLHFAATLGPYAPFGPPRLVQSQPGVVDDHALAPFRVGALPTTA